MVYYANAHLSRTCTLKIWPAQYHWLTHVSTPEEVGVLGETKLLQLILTQLVGLTIKMLLDLMEVEITVG